MPEIQVKDKLITLEELGAAYGSITPAKIGAVPANLTLIADCDDNTLHAPGGQIHFYATGDETLNTPYKQGLTGSSGSILFVFGSANNTTQICYAMADRRVFIRAKGGTGSTWNGKAWTASVTGIKGDTESSYRTGDVNLTPANIGAMPKSGGTMTSNLTVGQTSDTSERIVRVDSAAGSIYLFSQGTNTGIRGIYTVNAAGNDKIVISIDQNNNITCNGNAVNVTGTVQVDHGGTGATEARVLIGGVGYSSILNGINAVRTTRIFPISMRKTSDYCADAPSGYESSEANILLVGDEARITATLYLFAHPNGKRIYVRDFYQGNWFNQWTQIY